MCLVLWHFLALKNVALLHLSHLYHFKCYKVVNTVTQTEWMLTEIKHIWILKCIFFCKTLNQRNVGGKEQTQFFFAEERPKCPFLLCCLEHAVMTFLQ